MNLKIFIFLILNLFCFTVKGQDCLLSNTYDAFPEVTQLIESSENYYYQYKEFPKAVSKLNMALEISQNSNNKKLEALVEFHFAKIFFRLKNYSGAGKELQRAIVLMKETNANLCLAYAYLLFANLELLQNNPERATLYIEEINDLNIEDNHLQSELDFYQGKKMFYDGDYKEAEQYFERSKKHINADKNPYLRAELYYHTALNKNNLHLYDDALSNGENGLLLAKKHNYLFLKINFLELFSTIYQEKGQLNLSLNYAKRSKVNRDSLFERSSRTIMDEMNNTSNLSVAANTISKLSLKNSKQKQSLKFNQLAIILSVLLITILSLFSLSLYKNNNIRVKANNLLYTKSKEMTKAKEKAELAAKAKEQFLSTITHELRTPIYAITGLTYLLQKDNLTEEQKEHLDSMKYSGEHLLSLINNVLDLNKLEAGKVKRVDSIFNLANHMKNFMGTMKKVADDKQVKIHLELDPNIPKNLNGDMLKVSQVLLNLVSNAIKFAENGNVWIKINRLEDNRRRVLIRFEIEDDGVGIPKKRQKGIFKNFNQGNANINIKYGGTGLGLPIVKNLLVFLGSDIHLESEEGEGALFYFDMYFNKTKENDDEQLLLDENNRKVQEENYNKVFAGKKILVVEDNKLNQKITQKILEKRGMLSDVAENGKIALEKVAENNYDIILMDIHMPVMDGIEATRNIRNNNSTVPIIALTALSIDQGMEEMLKQGFTDFIPKPYKTELFFDKLYRVLQKTA